ncbi:MAG: formylmethanofuran dehydrogenase subunit C [Methanobacteriota archaeon]
MSEVTLKAKDIPETGLEAETFTPDAFAGKTLKDVSALTVYAGKKKAKISDYFKVSGKTAKTASKQKITIEGSNTLLKRIGEGMSGGEIKVLGDVGYHLGEYMTGGKIHVSGNAGSWIGTCMSGGEIVIEGNAGSYIGASSRGLREGMSGGRVLVLKDVGTEIGVGLTGGEIIVQGAASSFAGSYMSGGVIRLGGISGRIGYAMKAGVIEVLDKSFKTPFYFQLTREEGEFQTYQGDVSFKGKGMIKVLR